MSINRRKKLFFIVNVDWFFLSHRLPLALQALKKNYEVYVLAANTGKKEEIERYNIRFIEIPFERSGKNIIHEMKCISMLIEIYKEYRPDIIHQVTLKAAILGSIAAKKAGIRNVVNAISGFGYNFTSGRNGLHQRILKRVLTYAFKSDDFYYIVQNPDDKQMLELMNLTPDNHIELIKGSGVDLNKFVFTKPLQKKQIIYLFPARILLDKGVMEFIEAAKTVKDRLQGKAKFILAGDCDTGNLAVLPEEKLHRHLDENYIEWIGFQKNMVDVYMESNVVVLPSYREGLPKSLIEACAVGRPIITTDVPGCRECVIEGYNGYLVPAKTVQLLVEAILSLFNNPDKRLDMGKNSRALAEKEFSIDSVIEKTFSIYNELLNRDNL